MVHGTIEPISLEEVTKNIKQVEVPVQNVSAMGRYKFLITLGSKQGIENAIIPSQNGLQWMFDNLVVWSPEEACQTRKVWLECWGLSLYARFEENPNRIGDVWGKVISVDYGYTGDLSCAKMLIDTMIFSPISCWNKLSIDDKLYDVHVREAMWEPTNPHAVKPFVSQRAKMLKGSNKEASRTIMDRAHACSIEDKMPWMEQEKEGGKADQEFQFLHSIAHRDYDDINARFSGFDPIKELSFKPSRPLRMAYVSQQENESLQDVGSESSGQEIPLWFEGVNKVNIISPFDLMFVEVQTGSESPFEEKVSYHTENGVYAHKGSIGSSSNCVERVLKTPLLEINISPQLDKEGEGVVLDEDDLVEAQIMWDLDKELGLQVSNERAMLKALSKV